MGPLAQSVRELKIPPDLSAFTPPATHAAANRVCLYFHRQAPKISGQRSLCGHSAGACAPAHTKH